MDQVSVRDLCNHAGDVLDRVEAGERLVVTRDGKPVAELVPLRRQPLSREELVRRARSLPYIDPAAFRVSVDAFADTRLRPDDR